MNKKKASRMIIAGFAGPAALLFSGLILYSASRFVASNDAIAGDSVLERAINVFVFFLGVVGVVGIIPGLIIGIIGIVRRSKNLKD